MIVVAAMPVTNAKARAIPKKIFFMIVLVRWSLMVEDKTGLGDLN